MVHSVDAYQRCYNRDSAWGIMQLNLNRFKNIIFSYMIIMVITYQNTIKLGRGIFNEWSIKQFKRMLFILY